MLLPTYTSLRLNTAVLHHRCTPPLDNDYDIFNAPKHPAITQEFQLITEIRFLKFKAYFDTQGNYSHSDGVDS